MEFDRFNHDDPKKFGKANVVLPSPPYVVPSKENNGTFWLMGRSWPLQSAQPDGAKFPAKILISPMNGFAIRRSSSG